MKKIPSGLGTYDENHDAQKKNGLFPTILVKRDPSLRNRFRQKKVYLYRSIIFSSDQKQKGRQTCAPLEEGSPGCVPCKD